MLPGVFISCLVAVIKHLTQRLTEGRPYFGSRFVGATAEHSWSCCLHSQETEMFLMLSLLSFYSVQDHNPAHRTVHIPDKSLLLNSPNKKIVP